MWKRLLLVSEKSLPKADGKEIKNQGGVWGRTELAPSCFLQRRLLAAGLTGIVKEDDMSELLNAD